MRQGQQPVHTGVPIIKTKEPIEWKAEGWWRNRSVEERLGWLHLPQRIEQGLLNVPPSELIFVDEFEPGHNLYITGQRGKSLLAAVTLIKLVSTRPLSGRWIQADQYIEAIKDSFDQPEGLLGDEYSSPYLIKNVQAVFDVVVLDGLGDERRTEFAAHEIGSLIRTRYDKMKTTIITSRLSILDIANRYGERLSEPMSEFDVEVIRRRE